MQQKHYCFNAEILITVVKKRSSLKSVVVETIIFKLHAKLHELTVLFATDQNQISSWAIKGITSEVMVKKSYTQVVAKLVDLTIKDLNPNSVHTKVSVFFFVMMYTF